MFDLLLTENQNLLIPSPTSRMVDTDRLSEWVQQGFEDSTLMGTRRAFLRNRLQYIPHEAFLIQLLCASKAAYELVRQRDYVVLLDGEPHKSKAWSVGLSSTEVPWDPQRIYYSHPKILEARHSPEVVVFVDDLVSSGGQIGETLATVRKIWTTTELIVAAPFIGNHAREYLSRTFGVTFLGENNQVSVPTFEIATGIPQSAVVFDHRIPDEYSFPVVLRSFLSDGSIPYKDLLHPFWNQEERCFRAQMQDVTENA